MDVTAARQVADGVRPNRTIIVALGIGLALAALIGWLVHRTRHST
jgi:hypothetical protein